MQFYSHRYFSNSNSFFLDYHSSEMHSSPTPQTAQSYANLSTLLAPLKIHGEKYAILLSSLVFQFELLFPGLHLEWKHEMRYDNVNFWIISNLASDIFQLWSFPPNLPYAIYIFMVVFVLMELILKWQARVNWPAFGEVMHMLDDSWSHVKFISRLNVVSGLFFPYNMCSWCYGISFSSIESSRSDEKVNFCVR